MFVLQAFNHVGMWVTEFGDYGSYSSFFFTKKVGERKVAVDNYLTWEINEENLKQISIPHSEYKLE